MTDATLAAIADELARARAKFPKLNSTHEAYAVIREELDEFWDEVKKKKAERSRADMRAELVQVAAMCVRTIEDCLSDGASDASESA